MSAVRIPLDAIQKAIYQRLTEDVVGVPVYDYVPATAVYPYIEIGDFTCTDTSTKTSGAIDVTYTFHVYSSGKGKKELNGILNSVLKAFAMKPLALDDNFSDVFGGRLELCEHVAESFEEGILQHGVLRYRWTVSDNNAQ